MTSTDKTDANPGWLLAVIPPAAYMFLYAYELGYCSYFSIPSAFISIDVSALLLGISVLAISSLGITIIYGNTLVMLFSQLDMTKPTTRSFLRMFPLLLLLSFVFLAWGWSNEFLVSGVLILFLFLLEFVFPLGRTGKTYQEKLRAQEEIEAGVTDLYSIARKQFGVTRMIVASSMMIALFLINLLGISHARRDEDFLLVGPQNEEIVLRIYGKSAIAVPFDRKTLTVRPQFKIIGVENLPLTLTRVGRLTPPHIP